jgi:prepilin-type N-terminal cleavage/methylation domain-containing protein
MFKSNSSFLKGSSGRRRSGYTLMEMMVALTAGTSILGAFIVTTVTVSNTMVAETNYDELNQTSRNTMDWLSADIRNASCVSSDTTATYLKLTNTFRGTSTITYSWDGTNQLIRTTMAGGATNTVSTMLKNCEAFTLNYYQRNPTNNGAFVPTSSPSLTKLVSVSWKCTRAVLGVKLNSESVQTANVVLRN